MTALNPKLVSIELGGNDVLSARSGIAIPGVTPTPYATWQPLYDEVLDEVEKVTKMVVITGLVTDLRSLAAFRRGEELWANRNEFAAFHVAVSPAGGVLFSVPDPLQSRRNAVSQVVEIVGGAQVLLRDD